MTSCQKADRISPAKLSIEWQIDESGETPSTPLFTRITGTIDTAETQPPLKLKLHLTKSMNSLDYLALHQNGKLLFSQSYYGAYIEGLCINPTIVSPVFFISSQDERVGIYYHHVLGINQQQQWQTSSLPGSQDDSIIESYVTCENGQNSDWQTYKQGNDQPCICTFEHDIFAPSEKEKWLSVLPENLDRANPLPADFVTGEPSTLELKLIEQQDEINQLIVNALSDDSYQTSRFKLGTHTFINLVLEQDVYENLGLSLIQKDQLWYAWTLAGDSSKGFHPIRDISLLGDGKLEMQMCISDCDWWGQEALVELDLKQLSVRYIESAND